MQLLEQRISQLMVSIISAIFIGRFVYYYAKAPKLEQDSHPGFWVSEKNLSSWDRITFAWNKANTGK